MNVADFSCVIFLGPNCPGPHNIHTTNAPKGNTVLHVGNKLDYIRCRKYQRRPYKLFAIFLKNFNKLMNNGILVEFLVYKSSVGCSDPF